MLRLASLALRGPYAAAAVATGLLFCGLVLPMLAGPMGAFAALMLIWASAAILALVLMRQGLPAAVLTVGAALAMLAVMSVFAKGALWQILLVTVQFWLPALIVAWVLRQTVRLDLAVVAACAIGLAAIVLMYMRLGDPEEAWRQVLTLQFENSGAGEMQGVSAEVMQQMANSMAKLATAASAVMIMLTSVGSVLLARFWQAKLFNPGGFQDEFHQLRFGKAAATVVLIVCAIALTIDNALVSDIAIVLMVAFLFQGLSVVHSLVKQRSMSQGWLVGVYIMMMLPHTIALLGALGLADNWLNVRRLPDSTNNNDS